MRVTSLAIPEIKLIEPKYFTDFRGYFCESYSKRALEQCGIYADFVQDNHSLTLKKGTVRGIHFQTPPHPQSKLVRCTRGRIKDVAVDLRTASPTFKKWVCAELSAENHLQLFIPAGFGHGFVTLEDECEVQYKTDDFYYSDCDGAIIWNDPDIGVDWGIKEPVLSDKDAAAPKLSLADIRF